MSQNWSVDISKPVSLNWCSLRGHWSSYTTRGTVCSTWIENTYWVSVQVHTNSARTACYCPQTCWEIFWTGQTRHHTWRRLYLSVPHVMRTETAVWENHYSQTQDRLRETVGMDLCQCRVKSGSAAGFTQAGENPNIKQSLDWERGPGLASSSCQSLSVFENHSQSHYLQTELISVFYSVQHTHNFSQTSVWPYG